MSRGLKTTIAILAAMVVLGLITLPSLRQALQRMSRTPRTEEQARREVMQVPIATPTDVKSQARIFWLSSTSDSSLESKTVEIALSADPVERSKQLINALIASAPSPVIRTLPPDATLLAFYIQPGGTAIADFSDALASGTPSGILSEQLTVDSIVQTLAANSTGIQRLKILIHGQQSDSLAGHLDLSGYFTVSSPVTATSTPSETLPPTSPAGTVATPGSSSAPSSAPATPVTTTGPAIAMPVKN